MNDSIYKNNSDFEFNISSEIPNNWIMCVNNEDSNGNNNIDSNDKPNLTDRFIMGTSDNFIKNSQGGKFEKSILKENLPRHNHIQTKSANITSMHNININNTSMGDHKYKLSSELTNNPTDSNILGISKENQVFSILESSRNENHKHNLDIYPEGAHNHGYKTEKYGIYNNIPINISPNYISMIYIMKVKSNKYLEKSKKEYYTNYYMNLN